MTAPLAPVHYALFGLRLELGTVTALGGPEYVLSGGAMLMLHGLRDPRDVDDVDVFVTERVFRDLERKDGGWRMLPLPASPYDAPTIETHVAGVSIHASCEWRHRTEGEVVAQAFDSRELVEGWWCVGLQLLLEWKKRMRPEHFKPIHAIDAMAIAEAIDESVPARSAA